MTEDTGFLLFFLFFAIAILISVMYQYVQRQKRQGGLEQLAAQHGLTYQKASNSLTKYLPLSLQARIPNNDDQTYRHIMQGQWGKLPFVMFDMLQGTSTKNESSMEQTAVAFHIAQANMPMHKFAWRPSKLVDTIKSALGYEFVSVPELARRGYVFISFDEQPQATAAVFDHIPADVYKTLLSNQVSVTCDGEWLIYFRSGKLVEADAAAFEQFMAEGQVLVTAALSKEMSAEK